MQKNIALSNLDTKKFFIFAVHIVYDDGKSVWIYDPIQIDFLFSHIDAHPDIYILPWYDSGCFVDMTDQESCQNFVDYANTEVEKIDKCDPYVSEVFGVKGIGEGLVFYPDPGRTMTLNKTGRSVTDWFFKVKGESHSVNKLGKPATVGEIVCPELQDWVAGVVTDARLEQGIQETGVSDKNGTGKLIGWMCADIAKEESDAIDLMNARKKVGGVIAARTRKMFFEYLDKDEF